MPSPSLGAVAERAIDVQQASLANFRRNDWKRYVETLASMERALRRGISGGATATVTPPTTAATPSQTPGRTNLANIYRPNGPKPVSIGNAWASGGTLQLTQIFDLSLPIRGIRVVFKGRCVIGGAGLASTTPEGFLNLISNVVIQGTNARQKGNITLYQIDLATQYGIMHLVTGDRAAYYSINSGTGETEVTSPGEPWPADNNPTGAEGTFDFRIIVDFPFYPFAANYMGNHPHWVPAYLVRNEEWKDSLQMTLSYAVVANGAVAGPLGTGAAGSTITLTAYGSGAGSPTVDVYSLPVMMGLDLKDGVWPGILSRTATPINVILQSAGNNVNLLNMQKQPTTRIFFKNGTSTVAPIFASLLDTNVTSIGVLLAANRNVRNLVDVFAHKAQAFDVYMRKLLQGYLELDFVDSGNPDSAFPGQNIGDGATFQLNANVAGVANAYGLIVQEQSIHMPTGPLYTF